MIDNDKLLRLKDIANYFSVNRTTIYRWVQEKKIPPPDKQIGRIPFWEKKTVKKIGSKE